MPVVLFAGSRVTNGRPFRCRASRIPTQTTFAGVSVAGERKNFARGIGGVRVKVVHGDSEGSRISHSALTALLWVGTGRCLLTVEGRGIPITRKVREDKGQDCGEGFPLNPAFAVSRTGTDGTGGLWLIASSWDAPLGICRVEPWGCVMLCVMYVQVNFPLPRNFLVVDPTQPRPPDCFRRLVMSFPTQALGLPEAEESPLPLAPRPGWLCSSSGTDRSRAGAWPLIRSCTPIQAGGWVTTRTGVHFAHNGP